MCDTMVVKTDHGILFAKNSDRDPNEAQGLEWHEGARHSPGTLLKTTWLTIPQVPETYSILISRPWWTWGAEMGSNVHGVSIGNEAVFTKESLKGEPGLLGMDLLRLALERSKSADDAVQVIVTLLEKYGQLGPCSYENPTFSYHNSFLIADRQGAVVLETAGRKWATEVVQERARSISNGLTIPEFARHHQDRLRGWVAQCARRQNITQSAATKAQSPRDLFAVLRDNGTEEGPRWSVFNGSMKGPNMRAGGLLASSQTVASWVSDLDSGLHWATGTADPALSLFKPFRLEKACELGPRPRRRFDPSTLWWRGELIHRPALRQWSAARELVRAEQEACEARWLDSAPSSEEALVEAEEIAKRWRQKILALGPRDTRPFWLRKMWHRYNRQARLSQEVLDGRGGGTDALPSIAVEAPRSVLGGSA